MTKHTPIPWSLHRINSAPFFNIRAGEQSIAMVYMHVGSPALMDQVGQGEANGEFIVRAVNSHEELLEALKSMRHADGCFCEASFSGPGCHPRHSPECESARAAIAKAEGNQ